MAAALRGAFADFRQGGDIGVIAHEYRQAKFIADDIGQWYVMPAGQVWRRDNHARLRIQRSRRRDADAGYLAAVARHDFADVGFETLYSGSRAFVRARQGVFALQQVQVVIKSPGPYLCAAQIDGDISVGHFRDSSSPDIYTNPDRLKPVIDLARIAWFPARIKRDTSNDRQATMARVTPMRRQYLEIKSQYPDCILMFRMGDFYEMFDEDAEVAARELDITLTARAHSKGGAKIPMAGVPYHAVDGYIAKLIEKGFHVAVCDQITEPTGRGIVEREVTRVMTPGTVLEPALLDEGKPNYLMALLPVGDAESGHWTQAGIAYVDISTGEFCATQLTGETVGLAVFEELARIDPREVIMPESWHERGVTLPDGIHLSAVQDWTFEYAGAEQLLCDHFRVSTLDGFGLKGQNSAISAAGGILQYLRVTQRSSLDQLVNVRSYSTASFMVLDQFTRRNLELIESIRQRKSKGSLLDILDRTVTSMGARLLRSWLNQPLLDVNRLHARLDAVEALASSDRLRDESLVRIEASRRYRTSDQPYRHRQSRRARTAGLGGRALGRATTARTGSR